MATTQAGSKVCMAPTTIGTPVSADTAAISWASSWLTARGFSQSTAFLPARQAAMTCAAWNWLGLQTTTTCTSSSAITSSAFVDQAAPARPAMASATSGSTSMTRATWNVSANRAMVGRWMAWVTGPQPRIPTPRVERVISTPSADGAPDALRRPNPAGETSCTLAQLETASRRGGLPDPGTALFPESVAVPQRQEKYIAVYLWRKTLLRHVSRDSPLRSPATVDSYEAASWSTPSTRRGTPV